MATPSLARRALRPSLIALALAAAGVVPALADAADASPGAFTLQSKYTISLQHASNPLLSSTAPQSTNGVVLAPELDFGVNLPTFAALLSTREDLNGYSTAGYSSADNHSRARAQWSGQRWRAGLTGRFDYDTTRTSELGASGLNTVGVRHRGIALTPQITDIVSERDELTAQASYLSGHYARNTIYNDYRNVGVTTTWLHLLDPADSVLASLQLSRFTTLTGAPDKVDNLVPMLGFKRQVNANLSFALSAGAQRSRSRYLGVDSTTSTYTYAAQLNDKTAQDDFSLSATRSATPQGTGGQSLATALDVSDSHKLSELLSVQIAASYVRNSFSVYTPYGARSYYRIEPSLVYHPYRDVALSIGVQRSHEGYVVGDQASSTAVELSITITPQPNGPAFF